MSLPRRDVKVYFDAPAHEALRRFCEHKGVTMGEWIEGLVKRELRAAAEEAIVVADLAPLLGIARDRQESRGTAGNRQGKRGSARNAAEQPPGEDPE